MGRGERKDKYRQGTDFLWCFGSKDVLHRADRGAFLLFFFLEKWQLKRADGFGRSSQ